MIYSALFFLYCYQI